MSRCEPYRLALAEDPDGRHEQLSRHLERCEACAAFARDAASLSRLVRALPQPQLPAARARPEGRTPWILAASVLAAALVIGAALLWSRPDAPAGPAAAPQDVDLLAALGQAHRAWGAAEPPSHGLGLDLDLWSGAEASVPDPTQTLHGENALWDVTDALQHPDPSQDRDRRTHER